MAEATAGAQDPGAGRVTTEVRGRVLVVRIDREAKRNAIDPPITQGIGDALDRLDDDPELWAGVLTGTATVFSAGTDMRAGMSSTERGGQYGVIKRRRSKPLVAAVEGYAHGGGMEVVLACDLVVASTTASFGLPEVKRSLVPTCAGMFRAPRALPRNVANELLLTGDPIDAERAERLGFVNRLVEPGGALDAAVALAESICRNGPVALRETMKVLDGLVVDDDATGWVLTEAAEQVIYAADDTKEGVSAFFERREPRWTGR
jgi:enoyl-CoA hydratase/carnithine racemase